MLAMAAPALVPCSYQNVAAWHSLAASLGGLPVSYPLLPCGDEDTTLLCALLASKWACILLITIQTQTHRGAGIRLATCPTLAGLQTARAIHPSLGSTPDL